MSTQAVSVESVLRASVGPKSNLRANADVHIKGAVESLLGAFSLSHRAPPITACALRSPAHKGNIQQWIFE